MNHRHHTWEEEEFDEVQQKSMRLAFAENQSPEQLLDFTKRFAELMTLYECAIKEVTTKLEVLTLEFRSTRKRSPINNIQSRIKTPESIMGKMKKKGLPYDLDVMKQELNDIAGVRVVCPFIDDIYAVADMLLQQDDIVLLQKKDYIENPKQNGYRSLHLVVEIPIFLSTGKLPMKVEVQIRTIAMNFWASLEHQIHYKKQSDNSLELGEEMRQCAEIIHNTDVRMQQVQRRMQGIPEEG